MPIEIKIVLDDAGQVAVTGPIDNKIFCYGLLNAAMDAVRTFHENAAKRIVQPATALPPPRQTGN